MKSSQARILARLLFACVSVSFSFYMLDRVRSTHGVPPKLTDPPSGQLRLPPSTTSPGPNPPQDPRAPESSLDRFDAWLQRWLSSAPNGEPLPSNPTLEAEGAALAMTRRATMAQLIRSHPQQALQRAIGWDGWSRLPGSVRAWVEKPFSETATFEVNSDCRPTADRTGPWQIHHVVLQGERLNAFVFGERRKQTTKHAVPLQGIRLGDDVAVWDSPVQVLDGVDATAARKSMPAGNNFGRSWMSGDLIAGEPVTAAIGGHLYSFASEEEVQTVSAAIAQAERLPGPQTVARAMAAMNASSGESRFDPVGFADAMFAAASAWTESPKKVLGLRLAFRDSSTTPYTPEALRRELLQSSDAIRTMSYGKTWLISTVPDDVLGLSSATYPDETSLAEDAKAAARAKGFAPETYDIIVYTFPAQPFPWAGLSTFDENLWINGNQPASVITHEFGHAYGLGHANSWFGLSGAGFLARRRPDGQLVEHGEYGDIFDIMGDDRHVGPEGAAYFPHNQFSMYAKSQLNWIKPDDVRDITTGGLYRVYRFDHAEAHLPAPASTTPLALRVRGSGSEELWIGYRCALPGNPAMSESAYLLWIPQSGEKSLIDATPLSKPHTTFASDFEDAGLPPFGTYVDPAGTVRLTHVRSGGTDPHRYLEIQVEFLHELDPTFELFTDPGLETRGLTGSYVNRSLDSDRTFSDWRATQTIAGRRVDSAIDFPHQGSWGSRATVGLTHGSDANWDDYSVQWDGIVVVHKSAYLGLASDDGSRLWVDANQNGQFAATPQEFVDNRWGAGDTLRRSAPGPLLHPGTYGIRIQFSDRVNNNAVVLMGTRATYDLLADSALTLPGLTGSYVNQSLRNYSLHDDWRTSQSIAGTRIDLPWLDGISWGARDSVGLTGGTGDNWDAFSVQWDGYLRVHQPMRMATVSDDGSRVWVDLDHDGHFGNTPREFLENGWGVAHNVNVGDVSAVIHPGIYRIRVQYEEGEVLNVFHFAGAATPAPATTEVGNALAFDGTGDHGVSRRLVSGDFTIEFWFRSTQVAGPGTTWWSGRGIVDASTLPHSGEPFYDGFGVSLGAGRILFGTGGGFETTLRSGFVADGRWHHVAATRVMESGTMTLHVDGIRVDEGTGSQTPLDAASNMTVGAMQWAWGAWPFWGAVDEIRVWDVARTDAEIARNYECSDLTHPHLLTYWRMNEGAGSLARSSGAFSSSLVLDGRVGWVPSGAVVDRCRFGRLVDEESMRRLWDLGSDPGSTWAQPGFPDAHWIGAQGTLLPTEGTNGTGLRPDAITYYFRQPFQVSDPASIASVMLQMTRVDGAIVYLNGMEVLRYGMPTGAIDHLTWALPSGTNISTTGVSRIFETLSADWLVAGINWLAVEVHRAGPSNAGLLFDASLFSIPREPACGRNQLVNGSFETPGVPDGFVTLPNGSAILPGWRPILDGAGYRNLAASVVPGLEADSRAADGNHLVDLTPGKVRGRGVQQTLATVPGRVYRVSFALGTARSNGGSGRSSLAASVAGNTYAFNVTAEGSAVAWEAKQFSFAAETSETTLAFYTVDADTQCFVGLDQVSVTDCCSDSTLKISLHAYGQGPNR